MPKLIRFVEDLAISCPYRYDVRYCSHPKDESMGIKNDKVVCDSPICPRCIDPYEPDDTLYMPCMDGVELPEGVRIEDVKYYNPQEPFVIYPRPGIRKVLPFPVLSNGKTNEKR